MALSLAVLVDGAGSVGPAADRAAPSFALAVLFFWSLQRPTLMPAAPLFAAGLALDALAGWPLGFSPLTFLLLRGLAQLQRRAFDLDVWAGLWLGLILALPAVFGLRAGIAALWWDTPIPLRPVLMELLVTALACPLVGALSMPLLRRLPRAEHVG